VTLFLEIFFRPYKILKVLLVCALIDFKKALNITAITYSEKVNKVLIYKPEKFLYLS
jgi:hypothetical protein